MDGLVDAGHTGGHLDTPRSAVNTHYGVLVFGGDPAGEHPDEALRCRPPTIEFICTGPEEFCWVVLTRWTAQHPLRMWETAEVLARDVSAVRVAP